MAERTAGQGGVEKPKRPRRYTTPEKIGVHIAIPKEQYKKILNYSKTKFLNPAALIRQMITEYIDKNPNLFS